MSYPKRTIELRTGGGFIGDLPAQELGPDHSSLMRNVIVRSGMAQRAPHSRAAYAPNITAADPGPLLHAINAQQGATSFWLVFDNAGGAWALEGGNATAIDAGLLSAVLDPHRFSSSRLNGTPVISNGADEPVYWDGSTLVTLPGWTATESCGFIAASTFHLFALDISGPGGTFNNLIRWSDAAAPGTIPQTWAPGPDNQAGNVELSDSPGGVLCAYPLRDNLLIYKPSAIYQGQYVEGNNVFDFRKLQSSIGALNRRSVCDVGDFHLVVTDGDIVMTDGTNVRSIGEQRTKQWMFNQLDQENFDNLFCSFNRGYNEVLIAFPSAGSELCDTALVYSIADNAFGVREIGQTAQAPVGLVSDTSMSNTWQDRGDTWEEAVDTWAGSSMSAARASMVFIRADELREQDSSTPEIIGSVLGKYTMSLGTPERVKALRKIHLRTEPGFEFLQIRAGGQMEPGGPIRWSKVVNVQEPRQDVNLFTLGRFLSIEVSGPGNPIWRLPGMQLEVEDRGYY